MAATDYLESNNTSVTVGEPPMAYDSMKNVFLDWLSNGNTKKISPIACITVIDEVSAYAESKKVCNSSIWSIRDYKLFDPIYLRLKDAKLFRATKKKTYQAFIIVGQLYSKFLREKPWEKLNLESTKGKLDDSHYIVNTVDAIAGHQEIDPEDVIAWLVTQKNANGTLFLERVVRRYMRSLIIVPEKLNLGGDVNRNVFACESVHELDELWVIYKSASNYLEVNRSAGHGEFSAGVAAYRRYLAYFESVGTKDTYNLAVGVIALPNGEQIAVNEIIDLDEAQNEMNTILTTHFAQFYGYSNKRLLFEAVKIALPMFLNDNGFNDEDTVLAIAKHLLASRYLFYDLHIWQSEPNYPKTVSGLVVGFGRANGGVFAYDDANNYLKKIRFPPYLTNILQSNNGRESFILCDEGKIVLAEALNLTDERISMIFAELYKLFKEENVEYVIPRDISVEWFVRLPRLDADVEWTPLLLQEIISRYPNHGAKVIMSGLEGQRIYTLAAAFVVDPSILATFADVVHLHLQNKQDFTLPRRMPAEALRLILRDAGMLAGGELYLNLHKVLGPDHRFAFSDNNQTVFIRER